MDGRDRILDFNVAEDTINLRGVSDITDFEGLSRDHIKQSGDNVVIND